MSFAPRLLSLTVAVSIALFATACGGESDDAALTYEAPGTELCESLDVATLLAPVAPNITWTVTADPGAGSSGAVDCVVRGVDTTKPAALSAGSPGPVVLLTVAVGEQARVSSRYDAATDAPFGGPTYSAAQVGIEAIEGWWTTGESQQALSTRATGAQVDPATGVDDTGVPAEVLTYDVDHVVIADGVFAEALVQEENVSAPGAPAATNTAHDIASTLLDALPRLLTSV